MSNINKQALRIPERKKHNWGQAVMRDCDFCQQWALTVQHADGGCICASCCDSEYTSDLKVTLAAALEQLEAAEKTSDARKQGLIRAHKMFQREKARAEAAEKRIAELEAREVVLPDYTEIYQNEFAKEVEYQVRAALKSAGIITKVGE